jgi:hypothetical protein
VIAIEVASPATLSRVTAQELLANASEVRNGTIKTSSDAFAIQLPKVANPDDIG